MNIYELNARIDAVSKKITLLTKSEDVNIRYIDATLKKENLLYRLSYLYAVVLSAVKPLPRATLSHLVEHVKAFNETHNTKFSVAQYEKICWIRKVNGELLFPECVCRLFSSIQRDGMAQIAANHVLLVTCLFEFYQKHHAERVIKIIISDTVVPLSKEDIDISIAKNIIKPTGHEKEFIIERSQQIFGRLGTEIAELLWLIFPARQISWDMHAKINWYFRVLHLFGIWPEPFMTIDSNDIQAIVYYAENLLSSEEDLTENGLEFNKEWLDGPIYTHRDIFSPVKGPIIQGATPFSLLLEIDRIESSYHDLFDYSFSRSFYSMLVALVVSNDNNRGTASERYRHVKKLLSDNSKPYVTRILMQQITKHHSGILPYLLCDPLLAPLTFYGLTKITLSKEAYYPENSIPGFRRSQESLSIAWKESFDIFLGYISIDAGGSPPFLKGLSEILMFHAQEVYFPRNIFYENFIPHQEALKNYSFAFEKLAVLRSNYQGSSIKPRLFPSMLVQIFQYVNEPKATSYNHNVYFPGTELAICNSIIKLADTHFYQDEISETTQEELSKLQNTVAEKIFALLSNFFIKRLFKVTELYTGKTKTMPLRFSISYFGFELVDWGHLYARLFQRGLLQKLETLFRKTIYFKKGVPEDLYEEGNQRQKEKILYFIKAWSLAIINIRKDQLQFDIAGIETKRLLNYLFRVLSHYGIWFSKDDLDNDRINVLQSQYLGKEQNFYQQEVITLLFNAFSMAEENLQLKFIEDFFSGSIELGQMLTAVNTFKKESTYTLLQSTITGIPVESFIQSRFSLRDLESAVVEAVNSDVHYNIAKPLIEKIEAHLKRHPALINPHYIYEIKLLLALKEKDIERLTEIQEPPMPNGPSFDQSVPARKKKYFIALYRLYNDENYIEAINIFETLLSNDATDYELAYRYLEARVKQANKIKDVNAAQIAIHQWNEFLQQTDEEKRTQHAYIETSIYFTLAIGYGLTGDYLLFEVNLSKLTDSFLFDTALIPLVNSLYIDQGMQGKAANYLQRAETYYRHKDGVVPETLKGLLENIDNLSTIKNLKDAYMHIVSLSPKKLIQTLPDKINNQRQFEGFLLNEILQAVKIMSEKIKALDQITYENKYNDLVFAILRSRFPFFNLQLADQSRAGISPAGKEAGELDFLVSSGQESLALVEAMVLSTPDKETIRQHIEKCRNYLVHCSLFFILTYYKGVDREFSNNWNVYKSHVINIRYESGFFIQQNKFVDISADFSHRNIFVGKTLHSTNIVVYHIFLNLKAQKLS